MINKNASQLSSVLSYIDLCYMLHKLVKYRYSMKRTNCLSDDYTDPYADAISVYDWPPVYRFRFGCFVMLKLTTA